MPFKPPANPLPDRASAAPVRWAAVALCALAVAVGLRAAGPAAVQQAGGAAQEAAGRSTKDGVYSTEQAAKGEEVYMNICVGCHAAATYKSTVFRTTWGGKPLSDLFEFISTRMPEDAPATLEAKEYAAVVAYLLKINDLPSGKAELPADLDQLKSIRLDVGK
jgi:mono/diheme cytochrome c family protein